MSSVEHSLIHAHGAGGPVPQCAAAAGECHLIGGFAGSNPTALSTRQKAIYDSTA